MAKSLHTSEYEAFRKLLLTVREEAGLTQLEVATRLSKPQSFVAKYEGGERRLDVIEFMEICEALKVDPNDLIIKLRAVIMP
jgi:transcriptional regulator with XRE-family HTH domain